MTIAHVAGCESSVRGVTELGAAGAEEGWVVEAGDDETPGDLRTHGEEGRQGSSSTHTHTHTHGTYIRAVCEVYYGLGAEVGSARKRASVFLRVCISVCVCVCVYICDELLTS